MADDEQESRFGKRGRALWSELVTESTPESVKVLVEEACRTADRLDRLHWACKREGIIEIVEREDVTCEGASFSIEIGNAMSEARQQGQALKNLLVEIDKRRDVAEGAGDDDILNGL